MASALLRPAADAELVDLLDAWSRSGKTGAIAALCEQVATSNVALLEATLFTLLDRDASALAPTLDLITAAIGRSRRSQQADARRA